MTEGSEAENAEAARQRDLDLTRSHGSAWTFRL